MHASLTTLIFDLDGTLIDSSASILAGFERALESQKISPKVPLTAEIIGPPLRETLATISGSNAPEVLDALAAAFKAHYDSEGFKSTTAFPGVESMLQQLYADGVELHIATNKRLHPTLLILEHLGWSKLFKTVYALDYRQPAFANKAAMIAGQLQNETIDRETAAYIGDRMEDGLAADANGLRFFSAEWGYSSTPINETPAHWIRLNQADKIFNH